MSQPLHTMVRASHYDAKSFREAVQTNKHRLDTRLFGRTPLDVAAMYGKADACRVLVEAKASIAEAEILLVPESLQPQKASPLLVSAGTTCDPATFEYLLSIRCSVNAKDYHGSTPLMDAICRPHSTVPDVVKLLLAANADTSAIDNKGKSALDWCKREDARALLLPAPEAPPAPVPAALRSFVSAGSSL